LFEAGIGNVVAPQGTAFTENQARILRQFVEEVVLCFDADAAGQKAAERSLEALLQYNLIVRIAEMPLGEDPDSIVRKQGREEFEQRIRAARDFFDYWIEREASATDLSSLGAKMQLARTLAATVGRVHDPIMRREVANKVSARIGVAGRDFEALLPKAGRERNPDVELRASAAPVAAPRHDVAMLCLLALRDTGAREFLLRQNWREVLAQTPDTEMLELILEAELTPEEPASVNTFMATLRPDEEALVSAWLLQKMPPNAAAVARDWWVGLQQAALRRQLQIAEGRMKIPQLTPGEVVTLQKQILDLGKQLHELSAPSPARVLDT
jgi:DNA primase